MSNLPKLTHAERIERQQEKQNKIIQFLGSGEVWTTHQIIQKLLGVQRRAANHTIQQLAKSGILKIDFEGRRTPLAGLTSEGVAHYLSLTETPQNAPMREFELGKVNDSFVNHHIQTQFARLAAEAAGWREWVPGKTLHNCGWKKIPDAIAINQQNHKVAVEIELSLKSQKRMCEVVSLYIQQIQSGKHDLVMYATPKPQLLLKLLDSITFIKIPGQIVKVSEGMRSRIQVCHLNEFPKVFQQQQGVKTCK